MTGPMAAGTPTATVEGDTFRFDAGTPCLQLLAAGPDLHGWARRAFGVRELAPPTAAELADARTLTDAVSRIAGALADGGLAAIGDIARVNRLAAGPDLAPQLGAGRSLDWAWPATTGQVLSTVARDAVRLLSSPDRTRVRRCAADGCGLVFLDTSRAGRRRWCSMARCGNRAKVRAFRRRRAAARTS